MINPFKNCMASDSNISIILKSSCFKKNKITYNIKIGDADKDKFINEIRNLIQKYEQ